jgi:hypothetical protein
VLSFEWEKKALTVLKVALERVISILIFRETNFLTCAKIQSDYLLKRNWILYWFFIFLCIYYENFEDYCVYFLYVESSIFYTRQLEEDWRKCHEILFWRVFTKHCWHIPILVKIVQKWWTLCVQVKSVLACVFSVTS